MTHDRVQPSGTCPRTFKRGTPTFDSYDRTCKVCAPAPARLPPYIYVNIVYAATCCLLDQSGERSEPKENFEARCVRRGGPPAALRSCDLDYLGKLVVRGS